MNKKKDDQLGISHGTACYRLKKKILFHLVQQANLDVCYRCQEKIFDINAFSIEHKVPWLDSHDPYEVFFDIDNIAFSHLSCNVAERRSDTAECIKGNKASGYKRSKRAQSPPGQHWCSYGQHYTVLSNFTKNKAKFRDLESECKTCRSNRRNNR